MAIKGKKFIDLPIIETFDANTFVLLFTEGGEYKIKVSEFLSSGAIMGEAKPSMTPVDTSMRFVVYYVDTAGTYTNFIDASGNPIVITSYPQGNPSYPGDLESGSVQLWGQNNVWVKHISKIDLGDYYTKEQIDNLFPITNIVQSATGYSGFIDRNGASPFTISPTGKLEWKGMLTDDEIVTIRKILSMIYFSDTGYSGIVDQNGASPFNVSPTGVVDFGGKGGGGDTGGGQSTGNFPSDYFQIAYYGQSLSLNGVMGNPIDLYDTVTFHGGIVTGYDPDTPGAADTYFGSDFIPIPTTGADKGKGAIKIIKQLIENENGIAQADQHFTGVINTSGISGASYDTLSDPTGDSYRRLLESVRRGRDFAMAKGKTYSVPAFVYLQGENTADKSKSQAQWYSDLNALFTMINNDFKAITGQKYDVEMFTYQIASFTGNPPATVGVPLAQLQIALEKPNVNFSPAMYQQVYADNLHPASPSFRKMDANIGVAIKRKIVDGVKLKAIVPNKWAVTSNTGGTQWLINMLMDVPVMPLVLDESINPQFKIGPPTNFGFSILNNSNVEIITGVTISRGNTLNIICNQNPTGLKLTYAIDGYGHGGNLRDSQGEIIKIQLDSGLDKVHNWAPIFEQVI